MGAPAHTVKIISQREKKKQDWNKNNNSRKCPRHQGHVPPCLHTLTFRIPEPKQFPAGTQKPAFAGFTVSLAKTSLGGTKR